MNNFEKILCIVPGILFVFVIVLVILAVRLDHKMWNNGYCECDGRWTYVQTIYYGNNTRTYLYKCNRCGKLYEFNEVR